MKYYAEQALSAKKQGTGLVVLLIISPFCVHVFYFNFTEKAPQLQFAHYDWWQRGEIVTNLVGVVDLKQSNAR